jgi:2-polyprenyl-3-methyl-5-hydroxy-6-metoxy-1,4-benzoquinol methylase
LLVGYGRGSSWRRHPCSKKKFPQVNCLTGSADLLTEIGHGQQYDLLVCSEVIEHVPNPFEHSSASALVKLVKANGYLVLSTPRTDILEEWTHKYGVPGQPTEDWVTEQELADVFVANGCEVVK